MIDNNDIIFILNDLKKIIVDIENKKIDRTLLINLNNVLNKVIEIMALEHKNEKIILILKSFVTKIDSIKLNDIKLDAFEYLGYIVYDINNFLKDYYIDKIHQDKNIIRDSLSNNIDFFLDELYNKKANESTIDFF